MKEKSSGSDRTLPKDKGHPSKVALTLRRYLLVVAGCVIYSFGVAAFIQPAQIVNGGVMGVLNLINIVTPIPVGIIYFLVNVPLLIISLVVFKWRFTVGTVFGTALNSVLLTVFQNLLRDVVFTENLFLNTVCGGVVLGVGLGLIMRNGASTGGTDILMKLLHRKRPHLSGGFINMLIDIVILAGYYVVHHFVKHTENAFDMTVFAFITVVIENVVYDLVLYGTMGSKTVYIITDKPDEITDQIINKMNVGATLLSGTGAYTHTKKAIILCVVKNNIFPGLKNAVRDIDDSAFMIVGKSLEIYGKGYKDYHQEVL